MLEKFKTLAPGTFKHCVAVGDICESVGAAFDIDADLLKLCGMYHDIGKMCNPKCFIENQGEETNIHDDLPPLISYQLLTKHVSDSVLTLINQPEFPKRAIEIIARHHGNTVLRSIAGKAKGIDEDNFRYQSEKPNDIYSSILICGSTICVILSSAPSAVQTPTPISNSISSLKGMPSIPISGISGFNSRDFARAFRCTATISKPRF